MNWSYRYRSIKRQHEISKQAEIEKRALKGRLFFLCRGADGPEIFNGAETRQIPARWGGLEKLHGSNIVKTKTMSNLTVTV